MPQKPILLQKGNDVINSIVYLAVLAYPESRDKQKKFYEAALSLLYEVEYRAGRIRSMERPEFARRIKSTTRVNRTRAGLERIRKERLCAGYWAIGKIFNRHKCDCKIGDECPHWKPTLKGFSIFILETLMILVILQSRTPSLSIVFPCRLLPQSNI